jgi:hypothetical protein
MHPSREIDLELNVSHGDTDFCPERRRQYSWWLQGEEKKEGIAL